MWTAFFFALSAAIASFCAISAAISARNAAQTLESVRRRLQSVELQAGSTRSLLEETQNALSDLANRVKMMRVRTAANHVKGSPDEPDPYKDPDGWRKLTNARLSRAKAGI